MVRKIRKGVSNYGDNYGSFSNIQRIVFETKEMENLASKTVKGYGRVFTALNEYFSDDFDAINMTHSDAKDFVRWLQNDKIHYRDKFHKDGIQRGIKPSTINTYLKICKSIYEVLVNEELIETNPFTKIPCMKRRDERIKTIPPEDIRLLLDSLDKHYYTEFRMYVVIHVLMDTFGRIDEVLSIRKDDIDFENRTILFAKTKNGEPRYVGFSPKTKRLINELLDECREFNTPYVFLGVNGERFQPEAFRANLKRYCNTYNIKTHITPHMFRHTAAMLFLENGGNMRVLQKILGHKKIATTEIYAHVSENIKLVEQSTFSPLDSIFKTTTQINMRHNKRRK